MQSFANKLISFWCTEDTERYTVGIDSSTECANYKFTENLQVINVDNVAVAYHAGVLCGSRSGKSE